MTANSDVHPTDNRRLELFKFYEEAAQRTKTDAWTQSSWILTLSGAVLGFSIDLYVKDRWNSPNFTIIYWGCAAVGIILSAYVLSVLHELAIHIRNYWGFANCLATTDELLKTLAPSKKCDNVPYPAFIKRLFLPPILFAVGHIVWACYACKQLEEQMSVLEVLSIFSSLAASIAAVIAYLGREAVSALQKQHDSDLRRLEESHKSELARQMEDFKRQVSFFGSVDTELRDLRFKSYSELWRITRALPRWPVDKQFTYEKLGKYSENLRSWYFGTDDRQPGGMLLTEDAAESYRKLQSRIVELIKSTSLADKLNDDDYKEIRELGSTLRTELTRDLLSRREAPGSTT